MASLSALRVPVDNWTIGFAIACSNAMPPLSLVPASFGQPHHVYDISSIPPFNFLRVPRALMSSVDVEGV
jgi:hypothetical protein